MSKPIKEDSLGIAKYNLFERILEIPPCMPIKLPLTFINQRQSMVPKNLSFLKPMIQPQSRELLTGIKGLQLANATIVDSKDTFPTNALKAKPLLFKKPTLRTNLKTTLIKMNLNFWNQMVVTSFLVCFNVSLSLQKLKIILKNIPFSTLGAQSMGKFVMWQHRKYCFQEIGKCPQTHSRPTPQPL